MLFFVLTTGKCNLRCRYCGGSFPERLVPERPKYDLRALKDLIEADPDPTVAFYGGEPLLRPEVIRWTMDHINARFVIQTNGTLFRNLERDYWNRMETILLSIDGTEETTDRNRGKGTYLRVLSTARCLKKGGYKGDLVARMAVSENTDIYKDVLHLLELGLFDHIHWQLDVGWSDSWVDFGRWCIESYEPGIRHLTKLWLDKLKEGKLLGIVPILGIIKRLRMPCKNPPCGAGTDSVAIFPSGEIRACPIAYDAEWALCGKLGETSYEKMLTKLQECGITGECLQCDYLKGCGGRCLYMNRERYWGSEGFRKICQVTKFTIDRIMEINNQIDEILGENKSVKEELDYPKFNNSTEIVP